MAEPTDGAAPGGAATQRTLPPGVAPGWRANGDTSVRAASLEPTTFNAANRTVDLTASTGATVRRFDWWSGEQFDEVLTVSAEAVDLTRFEAGSVSILNTHSQWDVKDVMGAGVPGTARFEDGKLILTAKLSARDDVAPFIQDIKDGILRNVSVGYRILAYEVDETTKPKTRTITRWELLEVSFVPVGADGGAGTRSLSGDQQPGRQALMNSAAPVTVNLNLSDFTRAPAAHPPTDNTQEVRMSDTTEQPAATQAPTATTSPTDTGAEQQRAQPPAAPAPAAQQAPAAPAVDPLAAARQAEADRIDHIRSRAAQLNLPDEMVRTAITGGTSVADFNTRVIDHLAAEPSNQRAINPHVQVITDEGDTRVRAAMAGLLNRANPAVHRLEGAATEYRGIRLMDLARDCLEARGVRTRGMQNKDIAIRALQTTSDFPHILSGVTNTSLREGYEMAPRTYQAWARQMMATDFRDLNMVQFGGGGTLPKVGEHGEFKRGKLYESKESFRVATYGEVIGVTRQVIINDNLDALTRVPSEAGFRAAVTENTTVYGILTSNPTMSDSKALFHSGHINLAGSGTALSVAGLSTGRTAMRKQKALDGKTLLNVTPAVLLVPAALETTAEQIVVTRTVPTTTATSVPEFFRTLNVVAEPLLDEDSATAWYLFANPASPAGSIAYAFLEGEEGVYTEERMGFDVDGMEIKIRHDFGAGAMDFRGAYKDPGAAPS